MPIPLAHALTVKSATIADGQSLSGEVVCDGLALAAIVVPSGWDAADITFQGSVDGTNFFNVHDEATDTEWTVQAGASRYIRLNSALTAGIRRLKVRSGTSGAAVNQTGAVTVQLVFI